LVIGKESLGKGWWKRGNSYAGNDKKNSDGQGAGFDPWRRKGKGHDYGKGEETGAAA
jgi:hypothetical protein